jgi:hypothetical protein
MVCPQVADGGEGLQIWKVAATPHHKNLACYEMFPSAYDLDSFSGKTKAMEKGHSLCRVGATNQ